MKPVGLHKTDLRVFLVSISTDKMLRKWPQSFRVYFVGSDESSFSLTFHQVKMLFKLQERGGRSKILQISRFCKCSSGVAN